MNSTPKLKALVLAGGKSERMGEDKSMIVYHEGISQQEYLAKMCSGMGIDSYISKGHDFQFECIGSYPVIRDQMVGIGPIGAILSAFIMDDSAAWLVLACDIPLLTENLISHLVTNREIRKMATVIKARSKVMAEPLIAIYEPSSFRSLIAFEARGERSLRAILDQTDVQICEWEAEDDLQNVNTQEEKQIVIKCLKKVSRAL